MGFSLSILLEQFWLQKSYGKTGRENLRDFRPKPVDIKIVLGDT